MSEAPERIEIESECGHANTYNSEDRRTWLHFPDNAPDYFYAEYVRADLFKELEAKLAKAVERVTSLRGVLHKICDPNLICLPKDITTALNDTDTTLAELKGEKR